MMFNTPLAAQASEIEELLAGQGFAKVKLVKIATGHDVVRAVINGVAGRFVLDTGAGKTVLNEARKKEYGIAEGMIRSETGAGAGGEFQVRYYPAKSVVLGQMNMELTEVATADLDNVVGALGRAAGFRIDGIIGQDALANADAILDVDGETLYLKKWSGDSGSKTKLQERWQRLEDWLVKQNYQKLSLRRLSTGHTTVQVEINGQGGDFVLDSGARASFLHSARLQKYGLGNDSDEYSDSWYLRIHGSVGI